MKKECPFFLCELLVLLFGPLPTDRYQRWLSPLREKKGETASGGRSPTGMVGASKVEVLL